MCTRVRPSLTRAATNTPTRSNARVVDFGRLGACTVSHRTPSDLCSRSLTGICTTLTTSGKLFDTTSNREDSRVSAFNQAHLSWLSKSVSKLIHLLLQSCRRVFFSHLGRVQISRVRHSQQGSNHSCDPLRVTTSNLLCHTWRISFSTISAPAAHVLTSWAFCMCSLELLE